VDRIGVNRRGRAVAGATLAAVVLAGCTVAALAGGATSGRTTLDGAEQVATLDGEPARTTATTTGDRSIVDSTVAISTDSIDRADGASEVGRGPDASTTSGPETTTVPGTEPSGGDGQGAGARPIPEELASSVVPTPAPWQAVTRTTAGGHLGVDLGCADGTDAASLDRWFAQRNGPVLGWDYQRVYPLGGDRTLWLFQDTFVDHTGTATTLGGAHFLHNAAMLQTGRCFTLLHQGSVARPVAFEQGVGAVGARSRWFWPMGGEVADGRLWVFWAEMVKDPYDPVAPDGLGWHPVATHLASYDTATLARRSFGPAPDASATPIYGYAVSSDGTHTYLFGNTFEQNLVREGGYWGDRHSATDMWLARVPRGQLRAAPEYRTADGWSPDRSAAVPISTRYHAENPMQPRFLAGRWVSVAKVNGYWGEELVVDAAHDPWGPWTTTEQVGLLPRGGDPLGNTYHAHLLPWLGPDGSLLVSVSANARDMLRDAWPRPDRYRPFVIARAFPQLPPVVAVGPPPVPDTTAPDTTTATTTPPETTPSSSTTTTSAPTTTTSPTTTTQPATTTSTTSTTTTSTTAASTTSSPTTP
jgi:hypothetical protein